MKNNYIIRIIRNALQGWIDKIDAGNSNISEDEGIRILNFINTIENGDELMSKREACDYIGVSRATFDNLVRDKFIPEGKLSHDGLKAVFWHKSELDKYLLNNGV